MNSPFRPHLCTHFAVIYFSQLFAKLAIKKELLCQLSRKKTKVVNTFLINIITNSWIFSSFSVPTVCPVAQTTLILNQITLTAAWIVLFWSNLILLIQDVANHLTFSTFFLQIWSTLGGLSNFWFCRQNNLDHRLLAVELGCAMLSGFLKPKIFPSTGCVWARFLHHGRMQ